MNERQRTVCEAKRDELIEDETCHLLGQGKEYDPFSKSNFDEAIANLPDTELESLREWCDEIRYPNTDTAKMNKMEALGRAVYCSVYEYWENIAKEKAKKSVPSVEELHRDMHRSPALA